MEKTVEQIYNELTEEQKQLVHFLVGQIAEMILIGEEIKAIRYRHSKDLLDSLIENDIAELKSRYQSDN